MCLEGESVKNKQVAFSAKKLAFSAFVNIHWREERTNDPSHRQKRLKITPTRRISTQAVRFRKFLGLKRCSSVNMRVKSFGFRYPNSAAMTFMGRSVAVNRSAAINKRSFLAYSLTSSPI